MVNDEKICLFSSSRYTMSKAPSNAREIEVKDATGGKIFVISDGLLLPASDRKFVSCG